MDVEDASPPAKAKAKAVPAGAAAPGPGFTPEEVEQVSRCASVRGKWLV
jgi:hypothetical protein